MDMDAGKNKLKFEYSVIHHSPTIEVPEGPTFRYFLFKVAHLNPGKDALEEFLSSTTPQAEYQENRKFKEVLEKLQETYMKYEELFNFFQRGITVDLRYLSDSTLHWVKNYMIEVEALLVYCGRTILAEGGIKEHQLKTILAFLNTLQEMQNWCPDAVERVA